MKSSDQKKLEVIYESEVFGEGVWDQIAHKAGTAVKSIGGGLANVGNRLANNFRPGEDQKNPVEAQVQQLWNKFRTNTLKLIEQHLTNQANLIDYETSDQSVVSKQIQAIKEAQKFLQDPPSYLQNAKSIAGSAEPSSGSGGGGGGQDVRPESGNNRGTTSRGGANIITTSHAKDTNPTPRNTTPTTTASDKEVTTYLSDLKRKNPALFDGLKKRIEQNLLRRDSDGRSTSKPKQIKKQQPWNPDMSYLSQLESVVDIIMDSHAGLRMLFEVTFEDPNLAAEVPKNITDGANREGEDVRFHGSKQLIVQTMKFFEKFRSECQKFIDSYDKVDRMGKDGLPTANKKIFTTIDKFLKRLLLILFIPGAGNLQGANPFTQKMV